MCAGFAYLHFHDFAVFIPLEEFFFLLPSSLLWKSLQLERESSTWTRETDAKLVTDSGRVTDPASEGSTTISIYSFIPLFLLRSCRGGEKGAMKGSCVAAGGQHRHSPASQSDSAAVFFGGAAD